MKRHCTAGINALRLALAAFLLPVAACAPLPPSPQDLQAKRFETLPDKAVVYLFRDDPDLSSEPTPVMVDDAMRGTTYPGTYFRLELAPGRHRIAGFAGDSGVIEIDVSAGRIHFLQQSVTRPFRFPAHSHFRFVNENYGREAVLRGELVGGR